jgi:hypothetical protein
MRHLARVAVVVAVLAAAGAALAAEVDEGGVAGPLPVDAFLRIERGMGEQQVAAQIGPPSAEGLYRPRLDRVLSVVGLGDAYRTYFYRGLGRVLLVGGSPLVQNGLVYKVEADPLEPGTAR